MRRLIRVDDEPTTRDHAEGRFAKGASVKRHIGEGVSRPVVPPPGFRTAKGYGPALKNPGAAPRRT